MNLKSFVQSQYSQTPHFVLFGNPVGHSLSPLMHNTAARHYNLGVRYYAVQLEQNEYYLVEDFLKNSQLKGVNLTIPFKYDFIKYCEDLDSVSSKIQAVNVLAGNKDGWKGYNTDVHGFIQPLKKYNEAIANGDAVIFGSGGAAKAVAFALKKMNVNKISIISRNPANIDSALKQFADLTTGYDEWTEAAKTAKLVVNTTPLGMKPHLGVSPVRDNQAQLLDNKICYDLIYNPAQTKFLRQAESQNAVTINGLDMLIHQGSKIFELWTGKRFPIDLVKKKLKEGLDERN